MRKFGLIGFPLTHSFSKKYFEEKFQREQITNCSYDLFPIASIEEFPSLLQSNSKLAGLNVTIPYKESVIKYLDIISDDAKEIGAVNCIKWNNRKIEGWNTDCYGFEISIKKFLTSTPAQTFVLGTGGSSKAVEFVLKKMNFSFTKVSREKKSDCIIYEGIASQLKASNLFVNTTPLGMFPQTDAAPEIPYELISENDFLFDLVYNPLETEFLKRGKSRKAKTKNGLEMLELQAQKSWEIWNN